MLARIIASLILLWPADLFAQRLPLRHYGTADGLPHLSVQALFQDSRGYLWAGTSDGLARFDGHTFVTYRGSDGLGSTLISSVFEDPRGGIWVTTNGGGVARLRRGAPGAAQGPTFEAFSIADSPAANRVNAAAVDPNGRVWAVTDTGLYRADAATLRFEQVRTGSMVDWSHAAASHGGRIWLGHMKHVLEIAGGRVIDHGPATIRGHDRSGVVAIAPGPGDAVYVASAFDVSLHRPASPAPTAPIPLALPLQKEEVISTLASAGTTLWIGTSNGLIRWENGHAQRLGAREGIPAVLALTVDREGHVWIGSEAGLDMIVNPSAISFSLSTDGLQSGAYALVESSDGRILASAANGLAWLDRGVIEWIRGTGPDAFGRIADRVVQDTAGHWWLASDAGLWWVPGPVLDVERAVRVGGAHGFSGAVSVLRLLRQPGGGIWVSTGDSDALYACAAGRAAPRCELRLQPALAVLRTATTSDGRVWLARFGPFAVLTDRVAQPVPAASGLPDSAVRSLLLDSRGWLWAGHRASGVSVSKHPTAAAPGFTNLSVADGLSHGFVRTLAEGRDGHVYIGTDRGVDRFDAASGRVSHLGAESGLDDSGVRALMVDRAGQLWVAQVGGVTRLANPGTAATPRPLGPYLSRLAVRGADRLGGELGQRGISGVVLAPGDNDVQFEFGTISFAMPSLRYQYRLHPAQADWSRPQPQRAVHFARLPPGEYRFAVRAVTADGVPLPGEATAGFRIAPPFWRTWWFFLLVAMSGTTAVRLWHRARLRRLMELARTRQQIAMDLHDDIGAGLVEVAILGELARRGTDPAATAPLARVSGLARAMRESMSDIVWAIDPERDRLADVVQRLRETAFMMTGSGARRLEFDAPDDAELSRLQLAPDQRRGLMLIFKEALANALRHAGECRISVRLVISARVLTLEVQDDGAGFDEGRAGAGHGLHNMRRRAEALGATLSIRSAPGQGTCLRLVVPVASDLPRWVVGRWLGRR